MNKAEKFANLAKSRKTTLSNRIDYFFLIRELRKSAQKHYEGMKFYNQTFNPYIRERLKKDGFKVKDKKDTGGKEYIKVKWIYKKKRITDDTETNNTDNTID